MADKKITRQLSIYINGKDVKNSLGAIGREIGKIKGKLKEANDPEDIRKYQKELKNLQGAYGDVKEELKDNNNVLQEAKGHFENLFAGFVSGDYKGVVSGLKGIGSNLKNITKAAWGFITTPIGAAITAFVAVGAGVKMWVDYNLEIEKTNQLVRDLTQESGQAVDYIRIRGELLQKTFEVDIKESIQTAKSLAKGFGISYKEAFDIIEDGAVRGRLSNGEFLDSLNEYSIHFKNAGFSAKEFASIVETGIDLSIYTDKLPDAIHEFGFSITEGAKSSRESLENAFGATFTNKIFSNVKNGSISVKEALAKISKEADKVGLNSQQAQELTASLFRSAGEESGGALLIFEAINTALNEQKKPLTEIQRLKKEELDLNKELEGVYTQLFASGSSALGVWIQQGKIFATQVLLKILKGGVDVYNWFVEMNNASGAFSATLKTIGITAIAPFKILSEGVSLIWKQFKQLGTLVDGIFTFDAAKIKAAFKNSFDNLATTFNNLKTKAVSGANEVHDAFQGKNKMKKFSLKDFVSNNPNKSVPGYEPVASSENHKTSTDLEKEKKLLQKKKELFNKSEQELNKLIKQKQQERLLNSKKGLEKELFSIDQKYAKEKAKFILSEEEKKTLTLEQIESRENAIQELEDEKSREKQELKKLRDLEFKEELAAIEEENSLLEEEERFNREVEQAKTDEERQLILLEKAKYIADEELKIERDKELAKVKEHENAEQMREAIRKKYSIKKAKIDKEFTTAEKALKSDVVDWTKLTEEQKLNTIKGALNGASQAFNEGSAAWKATKIAETTITTYQSAMNAYNALAGIPVVGPALGAAAAGLAVATGVKQVQKIASTPIKKMPKHFYGGYTGNQVIENDEYGGITGTTHKNEWVAPAAMTQSPRYAPIIGWLEQERTGNKSGSLSGHHTSEPEDNPTDPNTSNSDAMVLIAFNRLSELLEQGIVATSVIGDDNIQAFKSREQKINQAREGAKIQ